MLPNNPGPNTIPEKPKLSKFITLQFCLCPGGRTSALLKFQHFFSYQINSSNQPYELRSKLIPRTKSCNL